MNELFPFQAEGAQWLSTRRHALLGDKMGLGKTPQAVRGAEIAGARKLAVVCPAIGRLNWAKEVDAWSVYGLELKAQSYDMLVRYPQLRAEWQAWKPDVLVFDEGHYLKERDSGRTKMAYGQHCRNDGLAQHAGATWVLSGTLTPNYAHELYPHMRALFPQALPGQGSFADFLKEYCYWETSTHGLKVLGNKVENLKHLRMQLQPHLLRRTPEQVLPDLPAVLYGEMPVDGEDALRELRLMEKTIEVQELMHRLDDLEQVPDSDPHIASFRKACGIAKARPLAAMVWDELASNQYDKIVLFAYHRDVIGILAHELRAFEPRVIMGGMSDKAVREAYTSFQEKSSVRVVIGQINACSTTITLTRAHQVLFAEQSWVPSDNEQAIYRLRRIGQKSQVSARMAYLADSIDEAINRSVSRKVKGLLQLYGENA